MRTAAVALAALATTVPLCAQSYDNLVRRFNYDRRAPLEVREAGVQDRGSVAIHDISYASPRGGRVPAYLVVPAGKGPFAAIVWGHWYWENSPARSRSEFLDEAIAIANAGVVSVMIDCPVARSGYVADTTPLSEKS
ncbi:MAG TPA: hypothetical protein VF219_04010, partial [Vicinamibacterales bacterium]